MPHFWLAQYFCDQLQCGVRLPTFGAVASSCERLVPVVRPGCVLMYCPVFSAQSRVFVICAVYLRSIFTDRFSDRSVPVSVMFSMPFLLVVRSIILSLFTINCRLLLNYCLSLRFVISP